MEQRPEWGEAAAEVIQQLTDKVGSLEEALLSRDVIGQAKGILMERLHLTPDLAFEELRRESQAHNRKLRDLAAELAETGVWPLDATSVNGNGTSNGNGNGGRPVPRETGRPAPP